jgi:hypothetical protein
MRHLRTQAVAVAVPLVRSVVISSDLWFHQPPAKRTQSVTTRCRPSPYDAPPEVVPPARPFPGLPAGSCAALHHLPTQAVAVPLALALFPFVVRLCVICVICGPRPSPLPCRWFDPWRSVAICGPPPCVSPAVAVLPVLRSCLRRQSAQICVHLRIPPWPLSALLRNEPNPSQRHAGRAPTTRLQRSARRHLRSPSSPVGLCVHLRTSAESVDAVVVGRRASAKRTQCAYSTR